MLDVAASLDDEHIAGTSTAQNKILLYRTKTKTRIEQYTGHSDLVTSVRFNYNRKALLSASKDRTLRTWNIATAQHTSVSCPIAINNIDMSWSETILATTHLKEMRFWSLNSGTPQPMHTIPNAHFDQVTCARFSADERYVISTG